MAVPASNCVVSNSGQICISHAVYHVTDFGKTARNALAWVGTVTGFMKWENRELVNIRLEQPSEVLSDPNDIFVTRGCVDHVCVGDKVSSYPTNVTVVAINKSLKAVVVLHEFEGSDTKLTLALSTQKVEVVQRSHQFEAER